MTAEGDRVSFGGDRNVFKLDCGDIETLHDCTLKTNLLTIFLHPLCPPSFSQVQDPPIITCLSHTNPI